MMEMTHYKRIAYQTKTMNPTLNIRNRSNATRLPMPTSPGLPKADFRSRALTDFDSISVRSRLSCFRSISQQYFAKEARRHFAREAGLFLVMMMTAVLPLLNASVAVLRLIRV
jgi:hypothetical protein